MINVHFNGEVVRCRDMKLISRLTSERYDKENRCKYGIEQAQCGSFIKYCLEHTKIQAISKFGKCVLSGCSDCPQYKIREERGNKVKTFRIDWKKYRQIASAAHYLIKETPKTADNRKCNTLFLTLTFPKWKKKHKLTKSFFYDEISNKLFSKFAENLRENYDCGGYIAVKEYGEINHRIHFHIIFAIPFIDFRIINDSWNNSISDYCFYSSCAVRRDATKPAIIRNPARAIRYVCKYISKCYGQTSFTRLVFISNNILVKPICIKERDFNHIDILKPFKSIYINTFEHVTVYKITERKEFNKFCSLFLYPLFECSLNWADFYYNPLSPG